MRRIIPQKIHFIVDVVVSYVNVFYNSIIYFHFVYEWDIVCENERVRIRKIQIVFNLMEKRHQENGKLQLSRTRCNRHARAVPRWVFFFKYEGCKIARRKFYLLYIATYVLFHSLSTSNINVLFFTGENVVRQWSTNGRQATWTVLAVSSIWGNIKILKPYIMIYRKISNYIHSINIMYWRIATIY